MVNGNNVFSWLSAIPEVLRLIAHTPLTAVGCAAALVAAGAMLFQRLTGVK